MAFSEGQSVRLKHGQHVGTVHRKLSYFDHMYVIQLDGNHYPNKRLAHESELELLTRSEDRLTA